MGQKQLPEDFKEFLKLLVDNNVEFLLVGGWAVGFHGYPRFTADIDIYISIATENIQAVKKSMAQFGIPSFEDSMLTTPGHVFKIGRSPLLIEVINEVSGIGFSECYKNRDYISIDDTLSIPIISLEDLIINKSSTDRIKDKADLEYLKQIKKNLDSK